MRIGNKEFKTERHTYVAGILNVTPDSFSDGGRFNNYDAAMRRVCEMIEEGADILDIGGESTRPGYTILPAIEEIERVAPVIEAVKKNFDIPVSLDTYKSEVAKAGILAGADLINDIWGLKHDAKMAPLIAKSGAACCLMHNRKDGGAYSDFLRDVIADLKESLGAAISAGIDKSKIILDPGIGFAKTHMQNLQIIDRLELLRELGYPTLLGASRKSFIGAALGLPPNMRLEGSLAATVLAVMKGCMFVRVHDVKENVRAIAMTEAILSSNLKQEG